MAITRPARLLFAHSTLVELLDGKMFQHLPLVTHWIIDASLYIQDTDIYYADRKNRWCLEWSKYFDDKKIYLKMEWPYRAIDGEECRKILFNLKAFQETFGFQGYFMVFTEPIPKEFYDVFKKFELKFIAAPYLMKEEFVDSCLPDTFEFLIVPSYGYISFDMQNIAFNNKSDRPLEQVTNYLKKLKNQCPNDCLIAEFDDMAMEFTKAPDDTVSSMNMITRRRALNVELLFDYDRITDDCLESKHKTIYFDTHDGMKKKMRLFIDYCQGFSFYFENDKDHIHPLSLYQQTSRFLFPEAYVRDAQLFMQALQKMYDSGVVNELVPKHSTLDDDMKDLSIDLMEIARTIQ
jgi:hypothetical protein